MHTPRTATARLPAAPVVALCAFALTPAPNAQGNPSIDLELVSTGHGQVFPYRIRELDVLGNPTGRIVDIRSREILARHLSSTNGVLPVATWPTAAVLPNGAPGNQFLFARFDRDLDLHSVLSGRPIDLPNSFLTGALAVLAYDPVSQSATMVRGQAFVGGRTYLDDPNTPQLDPQLVQAVARSGNSVIVLDPRANGFPRGFAGDVELVADRAFVFVPDADANLSTFETFPASRLMRIVVTGGVRGAGGEPLAHEVCTATTVGADPNPPQVLAVIPGSGQTSVDPRTVVQVRFDKPVQPFDVGHLSGSGLPDAGGVSLTVLGAASFPVMTLADPLTHADLCNYLVTPAHPFPGSTTVRVAAVEIRDLNGAVLPGPATTTFTTGTGPGIVNAPVAPEAIYVGVGGTNPGMSVIDVDGFGQGTGDLATSNFRQNPNVGRPGVFPALVPGTSTLDAGGAGPLTLTQDDRGSTLLLAAPLASSVDDIHIGQPLDLVFDNTNINANTTGANHVNPATMRVDLGNTISVAPHPNPPRLVFPPPNPLRGILSESPTVTSSSGPPGRVRTRSPPCLQSPPNALVPGPNGLFGALFSGVFYGPQPPPASPPPPIPFCPYTARQQVGHFLYALDRGNRRVLALNSNRFTVLAQIPLADPFRMALSPNLRWLAVSNFAAGTVSIVDVDPLSPTFHRVLGDILVGPLPTALAWQPEGEDLLVCHAVPSRLTIISAQTGQVRRAITQQIRNPIDVAVTARQDPGLGTGTGTYFAFVLNADGTIAVYESGPSGSGPDDVVKIVPRPFFRARALHVAPGVRAGCWVAHVDSAGIGQLSLVELVEPPIEPRGRSLLGIPQSPERFFGVTRTIGGFGLPMDRQLSGNTAVDLAFDDAQNAGALPDKQSTVVPGLGYARHSGKGLVKVSPRGRLVSAQRPRLMFVALQDTGKVDVFDLRTGVKVKTLDVPGVTALAHYWRQ